MNSRWIFDWLAFLLGRGEEFIALEPSIVDDQMVVPDHFEEGVTSEVQVGRALEGKGIDGKCGRNVLPCQHGQDLAGTPASYRGGNKHGATG